MRFLTANALLATLTCAIAFAAYRPALAADDAAVRAADGEFSQAAAKGDTGALGKLLDADFQWIDATGLVRGRAQVLKAVPKMLIPEPIANSVSPDSIRLHDYRENSGNPNRPRSVARSACVGDAAGRLAHAGLSGSAIP